MCVARGFARSGALETKNLGKQGVTPGTSRQVFPSLVEEYRRLMKVSRALSTQNRSHFQSTKTSHVPPTKNLAAREKNTHQIERRKNAEKHGRESSYPNDVLFNLLVAPPRLTLQQFHQAFPSGTFWTFTWPFKTVSPLRVEPTHAWAASKSKKTAFCLILFTIVGLS